MRAAIFDVYGTLLEVTSLPADPEAWQQLWAAFFKDSGPSMTTFDAACTDLIRKAHQAAKARGIDVPEVDWLAILTSAAAEFGVSFSHPSQVRRFAVRHAFLQRRSQLMPGMAAKLRALSRRGILLGICSNAQAYTLVELGLALRRAGLRMSMFCRDLRFWSSQHGVAKPSPLVFQWLREKLALRGIAPAETWFVGDNPHKDIAPAQQAGFVAVPVAKFLESDSAAQF